MGRVLQLTRNDIAPSCQVDVCTDSVKGIACHVHHSAESEQPKFDLQKSVKVDSETRQVN